MIDLAQCAPDIHPQTLAAIIQVESSGNPLAINVNGRTGRVRASTKAKAVKLAKYYISQGYSVDLGLMQINSRNLNSLGVGVKEMFEPCLNIQAGAHILAQAYRSGMKQVGAGQNALKLALSIYNTGNMQNGFYNGYVTKYYRANYQPQAQKVIARPIPIAQPQPVQTLEYSKYYAPDNKTKSARIPSKTANNSSAKQWIKASKPKSSDLIPTQIAQPTIAKSIDFNNLDKTQRIDYYLLSQALTAPTAVEWNPPANYYSKE